LHTLAGFAELVSMTCASELDRSNPLAIFHSEFCRPENKIYLNGNSLGLIPRKAIETIGQRTQEWQEEAVEGWTLCGWFDLAERLAATLAALLGAAPDEVIFASSTTINLHQLLATYYEPTPGKSLIVIAWDCSHSAGAIDHDFVGDGVELAFGCSYKYLSGGPGAIGYLFRSRRLPPFKPGLAGWWGNEKTQFELAQTFRPATGAGAFQTSTPSLLSLAPLEASLEIFQRAGMSRIRSVSLALTEFLAATLEKRSDGFRIVTPRSAEERGGHVALEHEHARQIAKSRDLIT
jgi:kynureninase